MARTWATHIDLSAVRDQAADRTAALSSAARALSFVGSGYVVFPLAIIAAALLFALRRRAGTLLVLLGTFGAVILENLDKLLVARPRPPVHHLEFVTSYSFPSGHATQSTAIYGSILLCVLAATGFRGRALLRSGAVLAAVMLVAAICWSRIYLGVHYPTDVAGGVTLAVLWLAVVRRALRGSEAL